MQSLFFVILITSLVDPSLSKNSGPLFPSSSKASSHSLGGNGQTLSAKTSVTRIESSIERISELGPLLVSCPFTLKENKMDGRIPSTFYEIECLHCNKCGKNGSKCTQLVTDINAVFSGADNSSWTETITVKSGCNCLSTRRSPGNLKS